MDGTHHRLKLTINNLDLMVSIHYARFMNIGKPSLLRARDKATILIDKLPDLVILDEVGAPTLGAVLHLHSLFYQDTRLELSWH